MGKSKRKYHQHSTSSFRVLGGLLVLVATVTMAQTTTVPKLVVGITIDQLRTDYLQAFSPLYVEGGFKALLANGQVYSNVQYPFTPVDRASAVASLVTGTVPYNHGIVGQEWMSRSDLHTIYCVDDQLYKGVETVDVSSPKNLLVSTIGDELKIATRGKAFVYSVAPHREAAVLAAGHAADWAMWIDNQSGKWAGTSYYGQFPTWLRSIAAQPVGGKLSKVAWTPYNETAGTYNFYLTTYQQPFVHKFTGDARYRLFKTSALVNEEVTKAAFVCLENGCAGLDDVTDFLSVCYYAGHYEGIAPDDATTQLQDTYERLDAEIDLLLRKIDQKVGLQNTLVYVTSTGYDNAEYRSEMEHFRIPTGDFFINRCATLLNMYLSAMYGNGQYVQNFYGNQIYLDHKFIEKQHLKLAEVLQHCEDFLFQFSGVRDVFTSRRIIAMDAWSQGTNRLRNGYNPKCSGDILIEVAPGWNLVNENTNTRQMQRDSFLEFPLIFYGYGLKPESIDTPVTVDRIAPTIAHHIRIRAPNACSSAPLF